MTRTSVARYVVKSTEWLVRTAAGKLSLATYVDKLSKKESDGRLQEWQENALQGQFLKETVSTGKHYKFMWLKTSDLKWWTECLICAAQEQALRTSSVKYGIDTAQVSSLCKLSKEKTEQVTYIVSECVNLAKNNIGKGMTK